MGILEVDGDEPNTTRLITNQPEIEDEIRKFYSNLYKKRTTNSSDTDLRAFLGHEGYEIFHNCAIRNIPEYVYEQANLPLSEDEVLAASLSHFQDAPHLIYAPSLRWVSMSKISFCTAVINDLMFIKASSVLPLGPVRSLLTRSSWIIVACLSFCSALSFRVMRLVFLWLPYPRATPLIANKIYSKS